MALAEVAVSAAAVALVEEALVVAVAPAAGVQASVGALAEAAQAVGQASKAQHRGNG